MGSPLPFGGEDDIQRWSLPEGAIPFETLKQYNSCPVMGSPRPCGGEDDIQRWSLPKGEIPIWDAKAIQQLPSYGIPAALRWRG